MNHQDYTKLLEKHYNKVLSIGIAYGIFYTLAIEVLIYFTLRLIKFIFT